MFDFLDSDWFNITLEIIFILLIYTDIKHYIKTKDNKYIINIILTIVFAIWALYPYYNSYIEWDEKQKQHLISTCKDVNDTKLCQCIDDAIFKNYTFKEYKNVDKNSTEFMNFIKEAKEDCLDDSWF